MFFCCAAIFSNNYCYDILQRNSPKSYFYTLPKIEEEKKMQFTAEEIYAKYDSNNVLIVGFSAGFNEREDQQYFMIQDALEYDRQDIQLGTDTYYIELNNQAKGLYGGISNLTVERELITFELEPTAQDRLAETSVEIGLNCSDEVFEKLNAKLNLIFMREEPEYDELVEDTTLVEGIF